MWKFCAHIEKEIRLKVFKNRVLRGIFGPKRNEERQEWSELRNDELNDRYCSLNVFWVIKSRRMKWARHVARMVKGEAYAGLVGKNGKRDHLGDPGINGRIMSRWIFRKWDVGVWTGSSWIRIGRGGEHL